MSGNLSWTWSRTVRETQMPLGSASASRRAATLTPSPWMSSSSMMMSPRLMPMRNQICWSSGTSDCVRPCLVDLDRAFDRVDHACELDQRAVAHQLDDRGRGASAISGSIKSVRSAFRRAERPRLVGRHQPAVADHVRGENGGEPAFHRLGLITNRRVDCIPDDADKPVPVARVTKRRSAPGGRCGSGRRRAAWSPRMAAALAIAAWASLRP